MPLVLETLDARLLSTSQKPMHQHQPTDYVKIMELFRSQHDHTECVITAVNKTLHVAEFGLRNLLSSSRPLPAGGGLSLGRPALSGWSDIFKRHPTLYLRLSLTLDMSLSSVRSPDEARLPSWTCDTWTGAQSPRIPMSLHMSLSPSMFCAELPVSSSSGVMDVTNLDEREVSPCHVIL